MLRWPRLASQESRTAVPWPPPWPMPPRIGQAEPVATIPQKASRPRRGRYRRGRRAMRRGGGRSPAGARGIRSRHRGRCSAPCRVTARGSHGHDRGLGSRCDRMPTAADLQPLHLKVPPAMVGLGPQTMRLPPRATPIEDRALGRDTIRRRRIRSRAGHRRRPSARPVDASIQPVLRGSARGPPTAAAASCPRRHHTHGPATSRSLLRASFRRAGRARASRIDRLRWQDDRGRLQGCRPPPPRCACPRLPCDTIRTGPRTSRSLLRGSARRRHGQPRAPVRLVTSP